MKTVGRIVIVLVVGLVLAVVGVFIFKDSLAKTGIEEGATYALGTRTAVDDVSVGLTSGEVTIEGLEVSNPEGFETPHLLRSGTFHVKVRPRTLFSETVEVNTFEIHGLDVYVEQKPGGSNVQTVLDHLETLGGPPGEPPKGPAKEGKKVKVDTILITDVTAHVRLLPAFGGREPPPIKVKKIELKNVTKDNAAGVALPELVARVVPAIMAAVLEAGGDALPAELRKAIGDDLQQATASLGKGAQDLIGQTGGDFAERLGFGKETGDEKKGLPGAESLKDATEKVGEGVKDLFKGFGTGDDE